MERFVENLKRQTEDNPVLAAGIAAGLITATGKLLNAIAWHKEVNRRVKMSKKK